MSRAKIAPTLQDAVANGTRWSMGAAHDKQARAELRALLAVARAATRGGVTMAGERKRRMNAYYYSFEPTGVEAIDRLLSAVACAGKAYHHTDQWTESVFGSEPYEPDHRGGSPVEWIQNAAEDAAAEFRALAPAAPPDTESQEKP